MNSKDESGMITVLIASYYAQPEIAALPVSKEASLNIFEASIVGDLHSLKTLLEQDNYY